MSCGHAVTPESLTGWCRSLLDQVLGTLPGDEIQLKGCVALKILLQHGILNKSESESNRLKSRCINLVM